jgi:tRNA 2-thiocytidine biosynthesis protein TtcA
MLDELETANPGLKGVMLAAVQNVRPSHLLDRALWQRLGLAAASEADVEQADVVEVRKLVRR